MLDEVFYWVFNMSIASAICAVPVLLLRLIRRIPRRVIVFLWLIPFARMCIPVGLTGEYGLMTLLSHFTTKSVTIHEIGGKAVVTMMNHTMAADSYFPITYKVELLEKLFSASSVGWSIVGLALLIAFCLVHWVTMKEIRDAEPLGGRLYASQKVTVPGVYGVFRPRIVLPASYHEHPTEEMKKALPFILSHEATHIRRGDNFLRTAAVMVVCVHWFNPLAWLCFKLLCEDMELACDEAVLVSYDEHERKEYARVLLSAAQGQINVFSASFGGAKIRLRIENILSYRRLSLVSAIGFSVMVVAAAYILLTNAV